MTEAPATTRDIVADYPSGSPREARGSMERALRDWARHIPRLTDDEFHAVRVRCQRMIFGR